MGSNALYQVAGFVAEFDGRQLTAFADDGITFTEINPKRALTMGTGASHYSTERASAGKRVTINLVPGSADSAFMHAKYNTSKGGSHTMTYQQIGTLETGIGTQGVMISFGDRTRATMDITVDSFVIEFPNWSETSGGNDE